MLSAEDVKKINFKALEDSTRWQFRENKLSIAVDMGYSFVSEAIVMEFYKGSSILSLSKIFGVSKSAMQYHMKRWGIPQHPPGGTNHKTKTFPHIKEMIQFGKSWKSCREDLYRAAAEKFNVSFIAAKDFYSGRTWNGIGKIINKHTGKKKCNVKVTNACSDYRNN